MAMFNFEFTDPKEKAAQKPMRSYVDIDENGRASARIYTDEGDRVRGTVFEPFLNMAAQGYTKNVELDDAARKAKLQAIKTRLSEASAEQVEADLSLAEAQAAKEEDSKTGLFKLFGPTYKEKAQKAKEKTESVRQLMDSEFPEFSARKPVPVESPVATEPAPSAPSQAAQPMPPVPSAFTPRQGQVRIWNPRTGKFGYVPAATWSQNSKNYVAEGAILLP